MPLTWKRDVNPYTRNFFGILGVGPNVTRGQIAATGQNLTKICGAGRPPDLAGQPLDVHEISEASSRLLADASWAAELLLVHPEVRRKSKQLKQIKKQIDEAAIIPEQRASIPLLHPAAVFWLLPPPGPEVAPLPPLTELGLAEAGNPEDLALDIVFDS